MYGCDISHCFHCDRTKRFLKQATQHANKEYIPTGLKIGYERTRNI